MDDRPRQRFLGQVALVTGAASGIGKATALALAAEGAVVVCTDLEETGARPTAETAAAAGASASFLKLDVADEASWERVMQRVTAEHGRLDVLVNSAGVSSASALAETSFAEWRRVLAVNLDGAFLATKHALRVMREHGGSIVHVGSAAGVKAAAGAAAYSTSKAGLAMLVKAAAKECRAAGLPIRVNAVCPGGVKTPLWRTVAFFRDLVERLGSEEAAFAALGSGPGGPFAEPDDVAAAILFLASGAARFVTGLDLVVDGGYVL